MKWSQVRLIEVERRLRGATIEGELKAPHERMEHLSP
jgi:hypothetical protein